MEGSWCVVGSVTRGYVGHTALMVCFDSFRKVLGSDLVFSESGGCLRYLTLI